MDAASISILLTVGSASVVSILAAIQNSKCTTLSLCFGCINCIRKVPDVQENIEEVI
jgi:hypothetical protein